MTLPGRNTDNAITPVITQVLCMIRPVNYANSMGDLPSSAATFTSFRIPLLPLNNVYFSSYCLLGGFNKFKLDFRPLKIKEQTRKLATAVLGQ